MDSLFGVERSLNQNRWIMPEPQLDLVERAMREHDLPEVVARLLLAREIDTGSISEFLNPTLKENLPSPFFMSDMEAMADELAKAIESKKKFAIFGDFDVDGATSSAIFYRFLKACGIEAQVYIPDRLNEGYGPNTSAFERLKDRGAEILLVLDCGTTAFEIIAHGRAIGLDIYIFDHHETEDDLPNANFVINPKRKDDGSNMEMLAACGVVFMACVAINVKLRELDFYNKNNIKEPSVKLLLDLVALGTVCDMVPLIGVNRLLVKAGYQIMQTTKNIGLNALIDVSGITGALNTYHAGFVLGPRINAGSRIHKGDLGAQLLCTDDSEAAHNLAWTLNDCNARRKDIQKQMEEEAFYEIEKRGLDQYPIIVVGHPDWHPGMSGLVAGKIKEKYKKPACVIAYVKGGDGSLEGRGSGRSVVGIDLASAFIDARHEGLIIKGGGHAMAGGFTVLPDKIDSFYAFLKNHISNQAQNIKILPELKVDGVLSVGGANLGLVNTIESSVGPFGQGHEEPVFVINNVVLQRVDIRGGSHIAIQFTNIEGGARMKGMAFGAVGTELGEALLTAGKKPFHLAGHLKINSWQGSDSVELHVKDAAFHGAV